MTEPDRIRTIERQLGALRNIEMLLGHVVNLLHDAGLLAEIGGLDSWYAEQFAALKGAVWTETTPEVRAAIEKLEAELRS